MVAKRMRIVGWQVQPIVMADDGETLESRNVQGQFIPVKQWDDFKNGGDGRHRVRAGR